MISVFKKENKTLWEKENMLVTCIFSFFNNVFRSLHILCCFKSGKCCAGINDWLVVLRFNSTLTAKVISWLSVMCFLAFSHQYKHKFISKTTNYFSHMLQQSERGKYAGKKFAGINERRKFKCRVMFL